MDLLLQLLTQLCAWLLCLPNVFNAVVKKNRMVIILAILNFVTFVEIRYDSFDLRI